MSPVAPPAGSTVSVLDATLVHIAIRDAKPGEVPEEFRKKGAPHYRLEIFPKRSGGTVAFYSEVPSRRSPERPREVVWIAHGLQDGMRITIEAKPETYVKMLPGAPYTIDNASHPMVQSGPVALPSKTESPQGAKYGERWIYSVKLHDDRPGHGGKKRGVVAELDPDVIVQPDP